MLPEAPPELCLGYNSALLKQELNKTFVEALSKFRPFFPFSHACIRKQKVTLN